MLDNNPSSPAPTVSPTGDFVSAAREFSTAYCHGVNTDNAKHQREHDVAMRRIELDAAAAIETARTERNIKWAGISFMGVALAYGIYDGNTWLISQIVSLFMGIAIGSTTTKS
ncbi:hypothetical protein [Limnohabitans sp.]|uniref:hypothetical protein n=1 Tax=Limnohabitans sp. TaxID=1907725 RepID=UPI00286F448B|nr:hypothetical protein [Limnohabitans sp.]